MTGKPAAPSRPEQPDPEVPERARQRAFSAAYKVRVLNEYEGLNKAGKGALLRREGLYSSLISEWRKQREQGALNALAQRPGRPNGDPRDREIAQLRQQKERLEREVAKLKKVNEIQVKLSALLEGLAAESAEGEGEQT
jgi:transposase-like protein